MIMSVIRVAGTAVSVLANDDSEAYEFVVNGAVCAVQAYDGIRCSSDDDGYDAYLSEVFTERAQRAVNTHANQLGPIYV